MPTPLETLTRQVNSEFILNSAQETGLRDAVIAKMMKTQIPDTRQALGRLQVGDVLIVESKNASYGWLAAELDAGLSVPRPTLMFKPLWALEDKESHQPETRLLHDTKASFELSCGRNKVDIVLTPVGDFNTDKPLTICPGRLIHCNLSTLLEYQKEYATKKRDQLTGLRIMAGITVGVIGFEAFSQSNLGLCDGPLGSALTIFSLSAANTYILSQDAEKQRRVIYEKLIADVDAHFSSFNPFPIYTPP